MLIMSPDSKARHNEVTYATTSHLDLVPTILEWFGIGADLINNEVNPTPQYTGKSLLPLLYKGMKKIIYYNILIYINDSFIILLFSVIKI